MKVKTLLSKIKEVVTKKDLERSVTLFGHINFSDELNYVNVKLVNGVLVEKDIRESYTWDNLISDLSSMNPKDEISIDNFNGNNVYITNIKRTTKDYYSEEYGGALLTFNQMKSLGWSEVVIEDNGLTILKDSLVIRCNIRVMYVL